MGVDKLFDKSCPHISLIEERHSTTPFFSCLILGMAILQNGKFPTFMDEEVVNSIHNINDKSNPAISSLRKGLDKTGIIKVRLSKYFS